MPFENRRKNAEMPAVAALQAAWHRSAGAGLTQDRNVMPQSVSSVTLRAIKERSALLLRFGEPSVQNTYEQMASTGSVVVLGDAEGVVLCARGDADFMSGEHAGFFAPGVSLAEASIGANAVGTCIAGRSPVTVDFDEHYLAQFRSLCGAASLIVGPSGEVAGVLAAYGTTKAAHSHTPGFVRTVAVMIENRMLVRQMSSEIVVYFHPVAEYIGTIKQCIAVFGRDGSLLAANAEARNMLRISVEGVHGTRFNEVFCFPLTVRQLLDKVRSVGSGQFAVSLADGREVTLIVSIGANCVSATSSSSGSTTIAVSNERQTRAPARVLLSDLDLGDSAMQRAIAKASMILGSDIPLLIEGESGVGKEVFTAAFHNSGPRKDGPFVAVNCASIPEGLIESELFGHEEGAFTGAKRKGYQGKILQAHGGTLFLDEIGDMPLSLQARLLRVIQERQVTPLGSNKSIHVDVSIVCATHRTMRAEVAAGRFREDLYYRLNGLRVQLPALRQRQDLDKLVSLIIATEANGRSIGIDTDVRQLLHRHSWPGNIRELQMVLRTALAILGTGSALRLDHLPEELVQASELDGLGVAIEGDSGEKDLAHLELDAVRRAMAFAGGNVSKAARSLGISRKTLYRKMAQLSGESTPPAGHRS